MKLFLFSFLIAVSLNAAEVQTLRSVGAVGDGKTDDRAAIEKALRQSQGNPIDGEGLTYAVHGNIELTDNVDFRNATLKQTMETADIGQYIPSATGTTPPAVNPPAGLLKMVAGKPYMTSEASGSYASDPLPTAEQAAAVQTFASLRTLSIKGAEDKPISVRLEKIKVDRGRNPDSGSRTGSSGISIFYGSPVALSDIEVTGDGKGIGLQVFHSRQVTLERVNVHDIFWAPFRGDIALHAREIKDDFQWNHLPIYEFSGSRFYRVRIQEQLAGLFLYGCHDTKILDSTVARLGVRMDGGFYPWQADGMTFGMMKNLLIRNCRISFTWEAIDFGGEGNENIVIENTVTEDTFNLGFKFPHTLKNAKVVACQALRSGMIGFGIGPECENMDFVNCQALETGENTALIHEGKPMSLIAGFFVWGAEGSSLPRNITFENCAAINKTHPDIMAYGFQNSEFNRQPGQVTLTNFKTEGSCVKGIEGITPN